MKMKAISNLFVIILALNIPGRLPAARFVHFVDGWVCSPASAKSRDPHLRNTKSRTRESELSKSRSWASPHHGHQHDSISFSLSSITPLFCDKKGLVSSVYSKPSTSSKYTEEIDSSPKLNNTNPANDLFFIRPALIVDMDRASRILADGFFKGPNSNWFTYQYEKLITFLSLEANFPRTQQERSRYEIYVACCTKTGEVWGFVEIDARGKTVERTSKVYQESGGSPYMCNLAVDEKHKRKGVATSLVNECERQVKEWHSDDESRRKTEEETTISDNKIYKGKNEIVDDIIGSTNANNIMSNSVCLKVRESNKAAVQMYRKMGYATLSEEIEYRKTRETILLMQKELLSSSAPPSPVEEFSS